KVRHVEDQPDHPGATVAIEAAAREMASVVARLQEFAVPPLERPSQPVSLARACRDMVALTHAEFGPGSPVRLDVKVAKVNDVEAQPEMLVEILTALALLARDLATAG